MGCVLGDHVKTAIGTRIMTGTLVGTGGMCAASHPPPTETERFVWLTDDGASRFRRAKIEQVARTVLQRRGIVRSVAYVEELRELHGGDGA